MKILVIDDDTAILEAIGLMAEQFGYVPLLHSNIDNIFSKIKKSSPNIIFVDIMLNGRDGTKIIKKLKSEGSTKNISTIILSASNKIKKLVLESGADGFLAKPFDIEDFRAIVEKFAK